MSAFFTKLIAIYCCGTKGSPNECICVCVCVCVCVCSCAFVVDMIIIHKRQKIISIFLFLRVFKILRKKIVGGRFLFCFLRADALFLIFYFFFNHVQAEY